VSVGNVNAAVDALIRLWVNGRVAAELVASPVELEDLAIGYAYSEGLVSSPSEISELRVAGCDVYMQLSGRAGPARGRREAGKSAEGLRVKPEELARLVAEFERLTARHVYPQLALHTSALYVSGEWLVAHDVSRHASVIKLVGKCARRGCAGFKIAFTTGRVSRDMALKLAAVGVDEIVSLKGPLYSGVRAACALGIPLVVSVRGAGFVAVCGGVRES
jgi:FdhD protein